ncbi:hypothetical protein ACFE04_024589 [Oxalis oulophora]
MLSSIQKHSDPNSFTHHQLLDLLQPSNFSIRDYVFAARSKDIKTNWPFSSKSLQLCFKHGMKEVLPPFQSLDSVRNKPINTCATEIISLQKRNTSHVDKEPREPGHRVADRFQHTKKLQNSSPPGHGNYFPSTTQSEIEAALNNKSSSFTPIEGRPTGKKCKLIVKFGGNSDRSLTEDIASNCTTVSESMASKVCPVCRTFSSSSNTTLNAHIDQCLSTEATPKWTASSELTRHRIKPKRTRLMVDIYVDAKRCTLEELDRRNGRFFDKTIDQAAEKVQIPAEGMRKRVHPEGSCDVGPVYIDASGTKLRILSKFNDDDHRPLLKVGENLGPKKALKGSKLCKLFAAKKKRSCQSLNKKRHKKINLAAQSKKNFYSPNMRTSQIPKPYEPSNPGSSQQWTYSKRTGLAQKTINQDSRHVNGDSLVNDNESRVKDSVVGRTRIQRFTNLSEKVLSSPKKCKKIAKSTHTVKFGEERESSSVKRVDQPLIETGISDNVERSLHPMKRKFIELNKDNLHGSCILKSSSLSKTCASSPSDEVVPTFWRRSSMSRHADVPKTLDFCARKNVLSVTNGLSVTESRYGVMQAFRNTDSSSNTETDDELQAYDSESTDEMSLDCGDERTFMKQRTKASNFSKFQSYSSDEEESVDFSARGSEDAAEQVDGAGSFEGSVMSWNKSIPELTIHTKMQSIEDHGGPLCGEPLISPTDLGCIDGEGNYCNQEVFGPEDCMRVESQGNFFPEVDPIPIPGPPGSFLPSPRGMGSVDFPGNSSLATSGVHSSQDQHDFVDGDSSTSPVSATTSISNHAALRSDLKFSGPLEPQDEVRLVFSAASCKPMVENTAGEGIFKLDNISYEKRPLGFRNDDEPCCCQRKERVSHGVVNYQESQLLKRRAIGSATMPPLGNQPDYNPSTRLGNLDIRPANSVAEKGFLPVMKSWTAPGVKFPACSDSDSASPSTNPVLRLMGKNLMVINKDDDLSVPQAQPCAALNSLPSQFPTLSGLISPTNMPIRDSNSYHHMVAPQVSGNQYLGSTHFHASGIFLDQLPMNGSFRDHSSMPNNYNESEANRGARFAEGLSVSGISIPAAGSHNERRPDANVFDRFWPQDQPSIFGVPSPVVPSTSHHHAAVYRPASSSSPPVRWNRTPEGFVLLQQSSFMAPPGPPSSSTSNQAGTPQLYYSSSFL